MYQTLERWKIPVHATLRWKPQITTHVKWKETLNTIRLPSSFGHVVKNVNRLAEVYLSVALQSHHLQEAVDLLDTDQLICRTSHSGLQRKLTCLMQVDLDACRLRCMSASMHVGFALISFRSL